MSYSVSRSTLAKFLHTYVKLELVHPSKSIFTIVNGWIFSLLENELVLVKANTQPLPAAPQSAPPGVAPTQSNTLMQQPGMGTTYDVSIVPIEQVASVECYAGLRALWHPDTVKSAGSALGKDNPAMYMYALHGAHQDSEKWEAIIRETIKKHLIGMGLVETETPETPVAPNETPKA